jgi:hypothetical protein
MQKSSITVNQSGQILLSDVKYVRSNTSYSDFIEREKRYIIIKQPLPMH